MARTFSRNMLLLFNILFVQLIFSVKSQDLCRQHETCGDCMSDDNCKWCADPGLSGPRCFLRSNLNFKCNEIVDVQDDNNIVKNDPLTQKNLIQPQEVNLELRPFSTAEVEFTIGQSTDYPVDLYFLLDLSWSMNKTRNRVADQGGAIIGNITEITRDLYTGFGSFVEKALPPFTSSNMDFNCYPEIPKCEPPYSFYHRTNLRALSAEELRREVRNAPLAGNVDNPEGGLDALMQVMKCKERLGWRRQSRKIIFLATDRDYHYAMDGKLLGILERNDGQCHLSGRQGEPGYYTMSKYKDYPSISHINAVAQEDSFVVIFAVIPQYIETYQHLARQIAGSSVAVLEQDAANIVDLIKEKYRELTSTIAVTASNRPDDVGVQFKSSCGRGSGAEEYRQRCNNVEFGQDVKFKAEIFAKSCLKEPQTFSISQVGLDQDLVINLKTKCECPCEDPGQNAGYEFNSPQCNNNGGSACGVCRCNPGFSGKFCECDANAVPDASDPNSKCKNIDSLYPDAICSNRGSCQCGVCSCFEDSRGRIYGQFCECDDFSCIQNDGQMCSGHGDCACGTCKCRAGWAGDDCSCEDLTNECSSPYNNKLCSGNGKCSCNECQCDTGTEGGIYFGAYCEQEPSEGKPCAVLKDCVECLAFDSGPLYDENKCSECTFKFERVSLTTDPKDPSFAPYFDPEPTCIFELDNCEYRFTPKYEPERGLEVFLHVFEGKVLDCPMSVTLGVSIGLLLGILALGVIAIAIFKGYICIKDRREFAKFENARNNARFATNQNALYRDPVTRYRNPMYKESKAE